MKYKYRVIATKLGQIIYNDEREIPCEELIARCLDERVSVVGSHEKNFLNLLVAWNNRPQLAESKYYYIPLGHE
jgi:hypothetical protein